MTLQIYAQNALDGYSQENTARQLINATLEVAPSVAVFPEAYTEGEDRWLDFVQEDFDKAGYQVVHGLYEDHDARTDRHGLLTVVEKHLAVPESARLVRLAGRNAIAQSLIDPATESKVDFVGVHFNDRSEELRLLEVDALRNEVVDVERPTVLAGDMNAMHRESTYSAKITAARVISKLVDWRIMPIVDPGSVHDKLSLARIGSLGKRLSGMATGSVMEQLIAEGFQDADSRHRPTMPAGKPFAQLDHVMHTAHFTAQDFQVLPTGSSDHRGIVSALEL